MAVLLSACAAPPEPQRSYISRGRDPANWPAPTVGATWTAEATYDHAAGTAACTVSTRRPDLSYELVVIRTANSSGASSGLLTAISGDGIYPGSMLNALVRGPAEQRFSGVEGIRITPDLLQALRDGDRLFMSWTVWPYGTRQQGDTSLANFGTAYDRCSSELSRLMRAAS